MLNLLFILSYILLGSWSKLYVGTDGRTRLLPCCLFHIGNRRCFTLGRSECAIQGIGQFCQRHFDKVRLLQAPPPDTE